MNETENQEIEIDLLELLQEFKNNLAKIIGVALLFAAAANLKTTLPKLSVSPFCLPLPQRSTYLHLPHRNTPTRN